MASSDLETQIRRFFESHPSDVVTVYLFGSFARQDFRSDSDVDVAVLLNKNPPRTFEGLLLPLAGELESHLGKPVDLIVLNRAPVDLIHRVLRDGKLLMDLDPSRRIRFEVRARNEYFDLQPILKRYRRM